MEEISTAQAAAIHGVTVRRFNQIVAEDTMLVRSGAGKFSASEFGKWHRRRTLDDAGVQTTGEILDYEAERARLTKAQADKTELEVAQLKGKLIPVDLVVAAWQLLITNAKARLLGIATKIAPVVIAATGLSEIESAIKALVHEALRELAGDGLPSRVDDLLDRRASDVDAAAGPENQRVGRQVSATKPRKRGRTRPVVN